MNSIWPAAQEIIKKQIGDVAFETWFGPIKVEILSPNKVLIGVPDNFFKDWFSQHYLDLVKSAIGSLTHQEPEVNFNVNSGLLKKEAKTRFKEFAGIIKQELGPDQSLQLNPRYTFENFVVGPSNSFTHAACFATAESPAKAYNPLFIYGGVGLGKTHLMQAACHYISEMHKNLKLFYTTSESFTNELINAIQNRTTQRFREKYRNVDVLLIDDIHFIAGKESTQEEFFHTFNALYDGHKQIVLSSDRPPKTIPGLEERLVSRFEWGLVTDIQPPDFETRIAILKKKAERNAAELPDDILYYIADIIKTNIRELEGALIKVIAYSALENKKISLELVKDILKDASAGDLKKITVEIIQKKVANYFDIKTSDMKTKKRTQQVAYPRQVAMYLARELMGITLPEIGEYFGGRDHSTVIYACSKIESDVKKNQNVKNLINRLSLEIKS